MSEKLLHEAIRAVRDTPVDPSSSERVAERLQRDALGRRRPWKVLSLAATILLAFLFWPRSEPGPSDPTFAAPDDPERVDETPAGKPTGKPTGKPKVDEDLVEEVDETPIAPARAPEKDEFKVTVDQVCFPTSTSPTLPEAAARHWNKELADPIAKLRKLPGGRIVVRIGDFDSISRLLLLYRIPHTMVADLDAATLANAGLVFVPCQRPPAGDAEFAPLGKFVKEGGWLVASDWGAHWIAKAVPGTFSVDKTSKGRPEAVAEVGGGTTSPLVEGVFAADRKTRWWFEEASAFARTDAKDAVVLVRSPAWKKKFGRDEIVLACAAGKGRVVLTGAHFTQPPEKVPAESVAAMHRLVLNVLIERFAGK